VCDSEQRSAEKANHPMLADDRHDDEPDPLRQYGEWTEHRYDPGYWTGGWRVPPSIRNVYSTKDARWLGAVFVAGSLIGVVYSLLSLRHQGAAAIIVSAMVIAIPMFVLGLMMMLGL